MINRVLKRQIHMHLFYHTEVKSNLKKYLVRTCFSMVTKLSKTTLENVPKLGFYNCQLAAIWGDGSTAVCLVRKRQKPPLAWLRVSK